MGRAKGSGSHNTGSSQSTAGTIRRTGSRRSSTDNPLVYRGGIFRDLIRQYGYDRMGRDREYRDGVLAKVKTKRESVASASA